MDEVLPSVSAGRPTNTPQVDRPSLSSLGFLTSSRFGATALDRRTQDP